VPGFTVKELAPETWPDFVRVMEKHNGVWGGCWCVAFHAAVPGSTQSAEENREYKEKLVRDRRTHSALVYADRDVVGWCQFGSPQELPARMRGFAKLGESPPDWRITCFFVDRDHRRQGVSRLALRGALDMIAAAGGGTVDGYPIGTGGAPYSSSFLWSGTESLFAGEGFRTLGPLGKSKLVMRRAVSGR